MPKQVPFDKSGSKGACNSDPKWWNWYVYWSIFLE